MKKLTAWLLGLNKEEIEKGERYTEFYKNKEKNTSLEGYRQTKTARAMLFIVGFLMIFSLSLISAWDFDNVKDYDPLTQTATITNAFGLGGEIAKIKLDTPHNNLVAIGNNKVAEFTITAKDDFNGAFDSLEFYNLGDKETQLNKAFTLKYKSYEDIIVDDYKTECGQDPKNATGEVCLQVKTGSHTEQREIWTEKPNYDLTKDDVVTIGIFVEVKKGDRVEWIPTLFGVRIEEWAVWTESLNAGLNVYYSFDEGSGSILTDKRGNDNNGTIVSAVWKATTDCKSTLGTNCVYFDGADDAVNMTYTSLAFDWSNTQNVSILMWIRLNSTQVDAGDNPTLFDRIASEAGWYSIITDDDNTWRFSASPTRFDCFSTTDLSDNTWKMLVAVRNTAEDKVKFYVNGLHECNMTDSTTGTFTGVTAGKLPTLMALPTPPTAYGREATGFLTEFGLWNRTLTDAEITALYNGGSGLTYGVDEAPVVVYNTPANNYNSSTTTITFNCSATDLFGVQNLTMLVNNANVNTTTGGTGILNLSIQRNQTLSEGVHNWSCNAYDDAGSYTSNVTQNLTIDLTAPVVKIINPFQTNYSVLSVPTNITFNVTILETGTGSQTCVYYNNTANTTITCGNNATINLSSGWNTLSYWATDYVGRQGGNTTTFFINLINYTSSYTTPVIEGANHTIFFNISATELVSSSANLTYNGTTYAMSGTSNGTHIIYNRTLTAPIILADTNFWINITANINGAGFTSNLSQLVYNIPSLNITSTPCTDLALNFSLYDEENLTSLNGTYEYNFIYGTPTNSSLVRSYGKIEDKHSVYVCINASISTNWTIGQGEIFYNSPNYVERRYYLFNGTYIYNNSREISLYDLLTASQTSFKLEIEDNSLNPYASRYAQLVRYYPDLNEYKVVDIGLTDETGSSVIHVKTEDVDYRIGVYEQNGTLIKLANPIRMVCLVSPCTYTLKISPTETDYISFLNIDYTFTFTEATNIWSLVYADTSGNTQTMNLTIWKLTGDNTLNVCSTSITGASGALTCNTTGQTGTLKGEVYRSASPAILMAQKLIQIGSNAFKSTWGLWLSMILLIPIVFVFAFMSPVGMVVGAIVALIPALYFGSINLAIIGGIAVLGGIVLHFVKRIG